MDSLTQIVLGAAVGEAVLGRKIGNRAMLWGAIAGTIPDLDVFVKYFTDEISATHHHRGFSHSIVFSVLMAPVLGWLAQKIHSKRLPTFRDWSWLFFWCLVTHPMLDANTTWGTQFFWPFDYRLAFKNIFVVDPLYTIPFLICVVVAMFYKYNNPKRRRVNNIGLIVSTTYLLWSFVAKGIGYYQFKQGLETQEIVYKELETIPTPLNTIVWNAQVETETGFKMGYYSLFDTQPIAFSDEYTKNHHLLDPYKNDQRIQQIIKTATNMYCVEKVSDGLLFLDIRFGKIGLEGDAPFPFAYKITGQPNNFSVTKVDPKMNAEEFKAVFSKLLKRLGGN